MIAMKGATKAMMTNTASRTGRFTATSVNVPKSKPKIIESKIKKGFLCQIAKELNIIPPKKEVLLPKALLILNNTIFLILNAV